MANTHLKFKIQIYILKYTFAFYAFNYLGITFAFLILENVENVNFEKAHLHLQNIPIFELKSPLF